MGRKKGEMTEGAEAAASVCGSGTEAIWAEQVAEAARRPGLPRFAPRHGQLEWIASSPMDSVLAEMMRPGSARRP